MHDGAYVFVLFFFKLAHFRTRTRALFYFQAEALGANGAVLLFLSVVEYELCGWNVVFPNLLRNGKEVVNHVSLNTVGGKVGLIGYLHVVLIEAFGEVYDRCLEQFEVSRTANHDA